ncbi:lipopolysaccharide biosynthesis protein [Staphylococcus lugdunensis]|uniref:lipopolysaccharide biosynthesis protein n=1 Tax=Staphylococcus lugdunensis TaxID=28035 RepID=UPI000A111E58|nr:capsular biosynthesis protein [Staphylococcus lugdunensis]ARJ26399.1 capsular biosynthesis protein [Staphylococcus lugdunensis]MCH8673375.1 capsular biosynthesis protein [Staphylococcus lugdunensis]MCH8676053.1 capsular biosynthesis protein [Staphylococcus lugdunensis]MCI2752124.1 capsular biosynthesis protein [Staphylococcus lugdunensis]MCI2761477.1 capsular biosynthesis protein [Staphylococcus lugdunensis]
MNKSKDFIFSILSNVILMFLLQLFLLPVYSKIHTPQEFGAFILLLTLVNIISPILGNTLNNIRLINKTNFNLIESEYLCLVIIGSFIVMIITMIYSFVNVFSLMDTIFSGLWAAFLLIRSYLFVYYRLDFRFKSLLYISIAVSFVMLIGGVSMYFMHVSIFIVLFASEFIMTILMIIDYRRKFENFRLKFLNNEDFKNYIELIGANSVLNLINYSDRILLNLFLGTIYVPLFFVATTIGKISNLLINPIVTVLLSYEVDSKGQDTIENVKKVFKIIMVVSIMMSIVISIVSWVFIYVFYNEYISKVQALIFLANLGVILMSSTAVLQIKLVANSQFRNNLMINVMTLIIIVLFSAILVQFFNVYGYAIALIISAMYKHFAIYHKVMKIIPNKG